MTAGSRRITKAEWTAAGGLKNSRCWRKHNARGWAYYITVTP